ncbi:DUF4870 domain-containing protein [Thalassotalea sp. PLHSN55]|uniref:DUF4870 domain-containing protein n=1 Tax=Thalassotalea sp. PLHSN55 TaxID=3435888 RepID=UPI003F856D80
MSELHTNKPWNIELKSFCMLMHLSQLSGILIPGLGFFLPIIMWATTKDKAVEIDAHGKVILNWMLSFMIYFLIILSIFGVFGVLALLAYNFIFIIIGAIQANKGATWRYPLSIPFLRS